MEIETSQLSIRVLKHGLKNVGIIMMNSVENVETGNTIEMNQTLSNSLKVIRGYTF